MNEKRKSNAEEQRILETIKENLISDSVLLFEEQKLFLEAGKHYRRFVENPFSNPLDSLTNGYYLLNVYSIIPTTETGYFELQSGGLKHIRNKALADEIIKHYTIENSTWKEYNEIDKNFVLNQIIPSFNDNIPFFYNTFSEFENDEKKMEKFKRFLESDKLKNLVKTSSIFKNNQVDLYIQNLKRKKVLIEAINLELEKF